MKQSFPATGLGKLCGLFGKTRQAFYDHQHRIGDDQLHEAIIIDRVKRIRQRIEGIGGRQLYEMLKAEFMGHGIAMGRDRFYELLRKHRLLIRTKKRYVVTTDSDHPYFKWPDRSKELKLKSIEQLWVSDITYLSIKNGFVYLSLVTDAYSRKIMGHHVSQRLKAQGCVAALNKAIRSLRGGKQNRNLIHHSDRGIQYCCESYVTILQENNIQISMTQSGSPYDNAIAERVNGILKNQLGLNRIFKDYTSAVAAVCKAIDAYNRLRPHMSIGNLTPDRAHDSNQELIKKWKKKKWPVRSVKD
jgi:transposase InsO family protein